MLPVYDRKLLQYRMHINECRWNEKITNYHFEAHNKIMIQARIINYY